MQDGHQLFQLNHNANEWFDFVQDAVKPAWLKEAIECVLSIVNKFITPGNCDADYTTLEQIESIELSKIKIIQTTAVLYNLSPGRKRYLHTLLLRLSCNNNNIYKISHNSPTFFFKTTSYYKISITTTQHNFYRSSYTQA